MTATQPTTPVFEIVAPDDWEPSDQAIRVLASILLDAVDTNATIPVKWGEPEGAQTPSRL